MDDSGSGTAPDSRATPEVRPRTAIGRDVVDLLAAIVESSDDAIYSKNSQALITSWNPAAERLYGYSAEEIIGKPLSILIPQDKKGEEFEILDRILEGQHVDHFDTQRVTKDGRIVDVSITVSPVRNIEGEIVEASVIARDVSGVREAQAALTAAREAGAAREAVQEFLAMTAHDLKGPLSIIGGMAGILKANWKQLDEAKITQLLEGLERNSIRMANLVDDLLLLARAEAHKLTPNNEVVPLHSFLAEIVAEHDSQIELMHVEPSVAVAVDRRHLHRIITNYITNAIKYGSEPVTVSAWPVNGSVKICVSDRGEGIPEEFLSKLFAKFSRGPTVSGATGHGLGLAIAKSLAEANGGDAFYEPNDPSGSRFCVQLAAAS